MEQNIVIERHYLTPQMYRELYLGYPYYFTNRNLQPQSQLQPHFPFINHHPILAPSNNNSVPVFPQPNLNSNTNTTNQNNNIPHNNNTNNTATTNTTRNTTTNTATPSNISDNQAPAEIRNLINNLINNNTPFQLEVSTLPITRILNQFRAEINVNQDNDESSINLANINNISSVNVFSLINSSSSGTNSNTSAEVCSICQIDFQSSDIVRRLNNCSHLFHLNCIDTWLSNHNTCPTCRNNLTNNMTENTFETEEEEDNESSAANTNENQECNDDDNDDDNDYNYDDDYSDCEHLCSCCEDDVMPTENATSTVPNNTSSNSTSQTHQVGITNNNSNIHIFTSSGISGISGNNNIHATTFGEFQNDINHIINLGTPLINTIMGTNNTSSQLNSTHINGQVNSMINAINPLLAAFSNMMINNNQ